MVAAHGYVAFSVEEIRVGKFGVYQPSKKARRWEVIFCDKTFLRKYCHIKLITSHFFLSLSHHMVSCLQAYLADLADQNYLGDQENEVNGDPSAEKHTHKSNLETTDSNVITLKNVTHKHQEIASR